MGINLCNDGPRDCERALEVRHATTRRSLQIVFLQIDLQPLIIFVQES